MFSRHGRRLLFTFVQLTEGRSTRNQLARKQLRAKTIFHDRAFPHPHLSSWSSSFPSSSTSRHLFPLSRGLALFLPYLCQFHVPWSSYVSYLFLFAVLGFEFLHCVAIASFDINVWLFDQPVRGFQGNLRSHLLLIGTLFRKGNQLKVTLKNWSRGFRVFSQTVASQFPDSEIHVLGHKCAYCSIQVCVGFCCNRIFSYLWPRTKFCEKQEAKTSIAIYR